MSGLHEYKGKELLREFGIKVPEGGVARSADEAEKIAQNLGGEVVVKGQVWTTGRLGQGLVRFEKSPQAAGAAASAILGREVGGWRVDAVLVEKKLDVASEMYAGFVIDDSAKRPLILFSSVGGTGIEEIAREHPDKVASVHVNVPEGFCEFQGRNLARRAGLGGGLQVKVGGLLGALFRLARRYEARSAEINPLAVLRDGSIAAADCRITIDDYAVFRHPELGIEFARELGRPPTPLDRIAYEVEKNDYRGTFYFVQMETGFKKGDGCVGFHGAGGGGSMMSMDSLTKRGLRAANFADTSGNPPASKVYRAAKIILAQENIDGYFGSGSGVASQEQFHGARGLVKAFLEEGVRIPVVMRLGGNQEDKAVDILTQYAKELGAPVEGYKKNDSPDFCVERLIALMEQVKSEGVRQCGPPEPEAAREPYGWKTVTGGEVVIDHAKCDRCSSKVCVAECVPQILSLKDGRPFLNVTDQEAERGKCIECLACEVECRFRGNGATRITLPIPGLDEYKRGLRR